MKADRLVIPNGDSGWTVRRSAATLTPMIHVPAKLLSHSWLAKLAGLAHRPMDDLSRGLVSSAYQLYRVGTVYVLVAVYGDRLEALAIVQTGKPGAYMRDLATHLIALARDWGCALVETSTEDPRIVKLLQRLGSKVESWTLILEV